MKGRLACLLSLALALPLLLAGCGGGTEAKDLTEGVTPRPVSAGTDLTGGEKTALTEFSLNLLRQTMVPRENTLLSPVSLLYALGMTANGARGETLAQMEETLGLSVEELNAYLCAYRAALAGGDKSGLSMANAIWLRDEVGFVPEEDFLQTNADYYGAEVFLALFDAAAIGEINRWVKDRTGGKIDRIVDQIPNEVVMYLINALTFDGEWENVYDKESVRDGRFTTEDGTVRRTKLMYSAEYSYLEDEGAAGFVKYYAGRDYAFAALLPKEGVTVADYLAGLTGEGLSALLASPENTKVNAAIPKFQAEYEAELAGVLAALGMADAFDSDTADLSGLGSVSTGTLYIDSVLQKTCITVDERGTKAGAATSVSVAASSAPVDTKTVCLDRPFVYVLMDCRENLPLFLGTMMDVGG